MVHLNGRALPEANMRQDKPISNPYIKLERPIDRDALNDQSRIPSSRRVRSSQTSRGPRPLLPRSLKEALQLAELLSKSKLIPKGFETPETCLVGILYGMEVGLSPIAALQRMAVIDGRPTIWGDAALALVQASGLLQSIKEDVIKDQKAENFESLTAICTVRREGRSEPITGTFSIEDAKRAGLWQKPGPWTDYPKRMLIMRARAFALRDAFPDVLAGLYIREEFEESEKRQLRAPQNPSDCDDDWNAIGSGKKSPETKPSDVVVSRYDPDTENSSSQNAIAEPNGGVRVTKNIRRAPPPPPAMQENSDPIDMALTGPVKQVTQSCDIGTVAEPQCPVVAADIEQSCSTAEDPLDPETALDLLDSALCCALDLSTLEEIVDDLAVRFRGLSKDHQKRAQKIIARHNRRVEDLDRGPPSKLERSQVSGDGVEARHDAERAKDISELNDLQPETTDGGFVDVHRGAEDPVTSAADLPRGLKEFLPNLGLVAAPMTARRRRRRNASRNSLSFWNARQRLSDFKFKTRDDDDIEYDLSESGE